MKVMVLLANGFEETECIAPVDMLKRAGVDVEIYTAANHDAIGVLHFKGAGGLDHEHVSAADRLIQRSEVLAIGKGANLAAAQRNAQFLTDVLSQLGVGITGKDLDASAVSNHIKSSSCFAAACGRPLILFLLIFVRHTLTFFLFLPGWWQPSPLSLPGGCGR